MRLILPDRLGSARWLLPLLAVRPTQRTPHAAGRTDRHHGGVGYEVLDAGGDAAAVSDRAPLEVLDLAAGPVGAPGPSADVRRGSRRGPVTAAAVVVLLVGGFASHREDDPVAAPVPTPTAVAVPSSAGPVPSGRTVDIEVGTGLPLTASTDLSTMVSIGHARVPGMSVARQMTVLQAALARRTIDASYAFEPDRYAAGASGSVGVRVLFDRRLPDAVRSAVRSALREVDAQTSSLEDVTGTTVGVSVPAGTTCEGAAAGTLALTSDELDQLAQLLPIFGTRTSSGRAAVRYVGPYRSRAALTRVGAVLARACGAPVTDVTYTRGS